VGYMPKRHTKKEKHSRYIYTEDLPENGGWNRKGHRQKVKNVASKDELKEFDSQCKKKKACRAYRVDDDQKKRLHAFNGRKVYYGPRGGMYAVVNGKKRYVRGNDWYTT